MEQDRRSSFSRRRTSSLTSRSGDADSVRKVAVPPLIRRVSGSSLKTRAKPDDATSFDPRRRNIKYENTYRMEPKTQFPEPRVRQIVQAALTTLNTHRYDAKISNTTARLLSQRILDEIRLLNIERYKMVCFVTIGSKARQGLRMASRCLWNTDHDTFVTETLEKNTFFAVATVYALYYE